MTRPNGPMGRIVAYGSAAALVLSACMLWWMGATRRAVPDSLPPLDPELDVGALVLEAQGDLPELRLRDLRRETLVLFLVDEAAAASLEGYRVRNALSRFILPAGVHCVEVAGARDLPRFLRGPMERMMASMRGEWRFPIYVDYGSRLARAFRIPEGRAGLVVIERGEVTLRHAGPADRALLERLRRTLGAREPRPPPRLGGDLPGIPWDGRPLLILFLHRPVRQAEIGPPGMLSMRASMEDPSLRLVYQFAHAYETDGVRVVVAGDLVGFEGRFPERIREDRGLRDSLSIPSGEAALVAISSDRRILARHTGTIPMWRIALAAEALGMRPVPPRGGVAPDGGEGW